MRLNNTFFQIHDVFVVKNQICFIAAQSPPYALYRYNIDFNSMALLCNWITLTHFCAVVVGKHIYAIGGNMGGSDCDGRFRVDIEALKGCARFDTEENTWQEISPLNEGRSDAFGVSKTSQDKIFIAGGFGIFDDWLKSCEVYNIATDEWQFIASLTLSRRNGKMVLNDETIYVLGGRTKKPFKDSRRYPDGKVPVEWYDDGNDKWIDSTAIPITKRRKSLSIHDNRYIGESNCWLEVCSLKVFKGLKNNLYPIRF